MKKFIEYFLIGLIAFLIFILIIAIMLSPIMLMVENYNASWLWLYFVIIPGLFAVCAMIGEQTGGEEKEGLSGKKNEQL